MPHDLTRNTLAVFCIAGLLALSLWVLRPFLAATVWSTMIVVATWPWLIALQQTFRGRRTPAVLVMSVGMLLLLVAPLWWAISTITQKSDQFLVLGKSLASNGLPALPEWVERLPFVGEKINTAWTELIAGGANGFMDHVAPYAASTGKWVLSQFGGLGGMLIQFLLVVTISAILYASGEDAAKHRLHNGGYAHAKCHCANRLPGQHHGTFATLARQPTAKATSHFGSVLTRGIQNGRDRHH